MAAHRYWRLANMSNSGNTAVCIAEIVGRTVAGGSQVLTGGTASASTEYTVGATTYYASNAFDGNVATMWASTDTTAAWIQYDLGAGNSADLVEVKITYRNDAAAYNARSFDVQWSDDGAAWFLRKAVRSRIPTGNGLSQTFSLKDVIAAHRYWRISGLTGVGNPCIGEIAMAESSGGTNVLTGGTASASTTFDPTTYAASKALDGDATTGWVAAGADGTDPWWQYDLGSGVTKAVVEVKITPWTSAVANAPIVFNLDWSDDTSEWMNVGTYRFPAAFASGVAQTALFTMMGQYDTYVYVTTTGTGSITLPSDFNGSDNTIHCIGAGGGMSMGLPGSVVDGAGGGGGYSKKVNASLTAGSSYAYSVGAGGTGATSHSTNGTSGGDTWLASNGTATVITSSGVVAGAKGGAFGVVNNQTPAIGGAAASGIGDLKYSGGAGGQSGSAGGGGAAGPHGAGGAGAGGTGSGGAGGGGADGGATRAAQATAATAQAGASGTGAVGSAGGGGYGATATTTAAVSANGVTGQAGQGGSGAGYSSGNGSTKGGVGGQGRLWGDAYGPGGGGGGSGGGLSAGGDHTQVPANGGDYGGGQAGAWAGNAGGGRGGNGLLVLAYNSTGIFPPPLTGTGYHRVIIMG